MQEIRSDLFDILFSILCVRILEEFRKLQKKPITHCPNPCVRVIPTIFSSVHKTRCATRMDKSSNSLALIESSLQPFQDRLIQCNIITISAVEDDVCLRDLFG